MWRRGLVMGGVTLALAACGPMPGYVPKSERQTAAARSEPEPTPGVEYEDRADRTDESDRAATRRYRPPTVLSREDRPAEPAPTEPAPTSSPVDAAPAEEPTRIEVVELGRADTYYLIDRDRRMCFFIHKETSARVDCASIPEGRDVKPRDGDEPPPAVLPAPSAPAAPPSEGVTRRYVEPAPAAPRPSAPAPAPGADDAPSADELARFEAAFTQIACDRRQGSLVAPRSRAEAQGLSLARYNAIEDWATADERGWRMLVSRAYRECAAQD